MKLLVIDDHPVLREGLSALLKQARPETAVLQASSVTEGLDAASRHADLDVILLDLMMPGVNGFDAISAFGRIRPELPIIVLSSSEDPRDVRKALALGALGYVPKSASPTVLLAAVRLVLAGERYIPSLLVDRPKEAGARQLTDPDAGNGHLTDRQIEVLRLLAIGQPNKVIATSLDLSEKTVKAHVTAIFRALNVINRTQAAVTGRQLGIIE
jgi:two-component system, NarL family, nitrate/nitrite response regulator NarL